MTGTHDPFAVVTPDVWVMQLSRTLGTPGLPSKAVVNLRRADMTMDLLDTALRHGAAWPLVWSPETAPNGDGDAQDTTEVYDRLSSALRTIGGVSECFEALRVAVRAWRELDTALRTGGTPPEPWRR